MKINKVEYLGDGLYVRFDGYYIVLMANDPFNPDNTIYLEREVAEELIKYIKKLNGEVA